MSPRNDADELHITEAIFVRKTEFLRTEPKDSIGCTALPKTANPIMLFGTKSFKLSYRISASNDKYEKIREIFSFSSIFALSQSSDSM